MKHKLKKENNIFYLLTDNGEPCICPYKTGVPVQNKFGSLQILNNDCNSLCPHFKYASDKRIKNILVLHCTNVNIEYEMHTEIKPL